ncbi:uncharacterized protein JCM6883_006995 [Sporobolomyces salmoneus]|uniref:uncharacterized protein n=1 Tax=Sporobolomyces salmoneus TaxID=183962 RepID=UPI00317B34BE
MSPLVPPDFDDLRRYSLGTIPVTLDPNQPSRPPTERPPPHLRHRSSSSMSALPSRRHSSPYFVPERQARSLSVVSEAQLTFQQSTSSPKAFQCHFCDYATDPKYDRDRHARLHTGERPYSCSFCVSTFARSDARRRHEQSCPVAHEQQPSSSDSNHFPPPACPKLTSTPFLP